MTWEFEASLEKWEAVWEKVDQEFAKKCVAVSDGRQLMMAAEEIVSNIIFYGGTDGKMPRIWLTLDFGEVVRMEFADTGTDRTSFAWRGR